MDMGIAKSLDNDNDITMAGMVMGTPYYMSPEQARADSSIDQRSDIYSLGASLYHLVTGTPPYHGKSAMQVMAQKLGENPIPPEEHQPKLSQRTCKVINELMAIDVDQRPGTWDEVIELLKESEKPKKAAKKIHVSSAVEAKNAVANQTQQKKSSLPIILTVIIIIIAVTAFVLGK